MHGIASLETLIGGVFKTAWASPKLPRMLLAATIKIVSFYPSVVERYFSKGIYPVFARLQRMLFGWIPFSIGDVLYLGVIVLLLWRLVRLVRALICMVQARSRKYIAFQQSPALVPTARVPWLRKRMVALSPMSATNS